MALNKLMHLRNPYRKKPDFKALAQKYPEFRNHATLDVKGNIHLDFTSADCLRALTKVLLKEDWDLDVVLPANHLIPTIPLRLNYILWLEDLLEDEKSIRGLDIGTGASCVYPLLGAKKNSWNFAASEKDPESYDFAKQNIEKNNLSDKITVHKVEPTACLTEVLDLYPDGHFSFTMCNPPFFASSLEAWGTYTNRSEDRPDPNSVCTASASESIISGGEVDFVKKMIADSLKAKTKVRIFTSMVGKKTSLFPIQEELRKRKISNFGVTEFCQGRTMRWGIGWSFDPSVKFPKRPSKLKKDARPKPPVQLIIPRSIAEQTGFNYDVLSIGHKIIEYLNELKTVFEIEKSSTELFEVEVVAQENTWSHSRRKRRRERFQKAPELPPSKSPKTDDDTTQTTISHTGDKTDKNPTMSVQKDTQSLPASEDKVSDPLSNGPISGPVSDGNIKSDSEKVSSDLGKSKTESISKEGPVSNGNSDPEKAKAVACIDSQLNDSAKPGPSQEEMERMNMSVDDIEEYILKFSLVLKKVTGNVILTLTWQDGLNIELLHQVLQFFKNRLK